jgi:Xaa-Pro aminopeptidase
VTFSREAIEKRFLRIRSLMKQKGYDTLIVVSRGQLNFKGPLRYVSDFPMIVRLGYCVIPMEGNPTLILPAFKTWAQKLSWIKEIRISENMGEELIKVLSSNDKPKKVGIVGMNQTMPLVDYHSIIKRLPSIEIEEASELLDDVRSVKSEEELSLIRKTAEIADSGYELFLELVFPGKTEVEILSEIEKYFIAQGVEDRLVLICSGPSDSLFQLFTPTRKKLQKEDVITFSVEIAGEGGYWFQLVRTLSLGDVKSDIKELYSVRMKAENQFLKLMKPGGKVGSVVKGVRDSIMEAGYTTSISSGHGTGLDFAESPDLVPDSSIDLKENMIITLHPLILSDRRGGNLLANTYLLTAKGLENLSNWDSELKVL